MLNAITTRVCVRWNYALPLCIYFFFPILICHNQHLTLLKILTQINIFIFIFSSHTHCICPVVQSEKRSNETKQHCAAHIIALIFLKAFSDLSHMLLCLCFWSPRLLWVTLRRPAGQCRYYSLISFSKPEIAHTFITQHHLPTRRVMPSRTMSLFCLWWFKIFINNVPCSVKDYGL